MAVAGAPGACRRGSGRMVAALPRRGRSGRRRERPAGRCVVVPNVIGQPRLEAVTRIGRSGLVVRVVRKPSGGVPPGSVFAESPKGVPGCAQDRRHALRVGAHFSDGPRGGGAARGGGLGRDAGTRIVRAVLGRALGQGPRNRARPAPGGWSEGSEGLDGRAPGIARQRRCAFRRRPDAERGDGHARGRGVQGAGLHGAGRGEKRNRGGAEPQGGIPAPGGSKVRLYVSGGKAAAGPPPPSP